MRYRLNDVPDMNHARPESWREPFWFPNSCHSPECAGPQRAAASQDEPGAAPGDPRLPDALLTPTHAAARPWPSRAGGAPQGLISCPARHSVVAQ